MSRATFATPQLSVRLYKTISRETVDGVSGVSSRYAGKDEYIELTPFMQLGSSVRTSKNVRQPAGGFSISFADKPNRSWSDPLSFDLETVSGLVEPQDMIEIRMWHGVGPTPTQLPVIMRGFVSSITRQQAMTDDGKPQRFVNIAGQDYGKIWQNFQVIHLAAYAEGKSLLTSYALSEMFGSGVKNTYKAAEFVRKLVGEVINPYIAKMLPEHTPMPREITLGDGITVAHGVVNNSFQDMQGSIYDIMKFHGDVGIWNELYVEDRQDGVHLVYRPVPALHITAPQGGSRKIQDDAPDPVYVEVPDSMILSMTTERSDANVANFFWVNNSRFDLIDDQMRRLQAISQDSEKVSIKDYPNSAVKYYGLRAMYGATQQAGDEVQNATSGQDQASQETRGKQQEAWVDKRRRLMLEMNKDNVVFESGSAQIKGGPMRADGQEPMKAGDYGRFLIGTMESDAYVPQVDHDFRVFQSYTTTLTLERGEGFVNRASMDGGASSPWLAEQARRRSF